jgi:hypothetical protein
MPAAGVGGARGKAEENSDSRIGESSAGSWRLPGQQRSSLSAEEKTIGLKGDGGREPGVDDS